MALNLQKSNKVRQILLNLHETSIKKSDQSFVRRVKSDDDMLESFNMRNSLELDLLRQK